MIQCQRCKALVGPSEYHIETGYCDFCTDVLREELEEEQARMEANCGMTREGFCMLAGTELCDWECMIDWEGIFAHGEQADEGENS